MEKLLTITGTGNAMVKTPASAHKAPTNIPGYLKNIISVLAAYIENTYFKINLSLMWEICKLRNSHTHEDQLVILKYVY